jgi:hypothetical protein
MWLDQNGGHHAPAQMDTHHLFYSIKMMWNHIVPDEYKILPYKKYRLGPKRFTKEYCKLAVYELSKELFTRKDYWHYYDQMTQIHNKMKQMEGWLIERE